MSLTTISARYTSPVIIEMRRNFIQLQTTSIYAPWYIVFITFDQVLSEDRYPSFLGGRGVGFAQHERDRLERSPRNELCTSQHSQSRLFFPKDTGGERELTRRHIPSVVELDDCRGNDVEALGGTQQDGVLDALAGEAALGVRVSEHAHVVDEECLVLDRGLEPLEAVPSHVSERPPVATIRYIPPLEGRRRASTYRMHCRVQPH